MNGVLHCGKCREIFEEAAKHLRSLQKFRFQQDKSTHTARATNKNNISLSAHNRLGVVIVGNGGSAKYCIESMAEHLYSPQF